MDGLQEHVRQAAEVERDAAQHPEPVNVGMAEVHRSKFGVAA